MCGTVWNDVLCTKRKTLTVAMGRFCGNGGGAYLLPFHGSPLAREHKRTKNTIYQTPQAPQEGFDFHLHGDDDQG